MNKSKLRQMSLATIRMTPQVQKQYKESIALNAPETFALLGGAVGDDPFLITDFHFLPPKSDAKGNYVASSSYIYPDHNMLNYIIDQVLVRNGRYMIGLWHSHPGQYNAPSHQDLTYCSQIIANDDSSGKQWNHFLAPITTFDATGSDVVSGWILPKGGSAFHSANVITDLCHDGNGRRFIESSEECEKSEGVLGTQNVAGDAGSGAQMDELDRIFETECSRRGEALGYIQRYHAQRKLSAARRILRARSA